PTRHSARHANEQNPRLPAANAGVRKWCLFLTPQRLRDCTAVTALFPSFFLMLANATDRELARQIQYLKAEKRILRDKLPKRITVTTAERQYLLKYGKPLGQAIRDLITIVSPRTFIRWLNGETPTPKGSKPTGPGRPKTPEDIHALVF